MPAKRSRSIPVLVDEELRLPRPPGVIRQFWARHPLFTDILIALICLVLSLGPATTFTTAQTSGGASVTSSPVAWTPFPIVVIGACALLLRRRQWPVTTFVASLIGVNVGNRKRYLAAVIDRSRQLLVERDQHARLAASAERARIAREMHDIVSHSLTVIVALSEGAAATPDRDRARDATDAAAATARAALSEMRSMLGVLRSDATDTPLAPTEPVAPEMTVATAQRAGYPVTLTVTGDTAAPQPVRYAIGRIVQEGVTNAMRHAPSATATTVRIAYSDTSVRIDVRNDGVGDRVGTDGFGIRGLIERAAHVGGTVTAGPTGDGCWELRAKLPIGREETVVPSSPAGIVREEPAGIAREESV